MSSYMLEDSEISTIARVLHLRRDKLSWCDHGKFLDLDTDALALCLHDLNHRALVERYGNKAGPDTFQYKNGGLGRMMDRRPFYLELSRLIYQCSDGDVVSDPLFVFLQDCKHEIADQIIRALEDPQAVARKLNGKAAQQES